MPVTIYTILAYWSWVALFLAWVPGYFKGKRTIKRPNPVSRVVALVLIIVAYFFLFTETGPNPQNFWLPMAAVRLTPQSTALGVIGLALDLVSIVFAIWARITIGTNWSNAIALKDSHELVQTGPYAIVRHPIYAGMTFAALGLALTKGRLHAYVGALCFLIAFLIRIHDEDALMARQFPEAHKAYRMRTRALVPFIW